jgi:DNA polymerase
MVPRHGWPEISPAQHRSTMAAASALGLPARLSMAADALELANRKDVAGERLMHQMSKPRRARQDEDPSQVHWFEDDDRLRRLHDYCRQDVEVERELFDQLPRLSPAEHALWLLSCEINERGFCVDRQFAEAARRIAQAAAPEIDAELAEITGGTVTGINQVARLLQWLQQQGCTAQKLDRKAIERQLEKEDLPLAVQRVLELRLGGAQAAVKKIDALLDRTGGAQWSSRPEQQIQRAVFEHLALRGAPAMLRGAVPVCSPTADTASSRSGRTRTRRPHERAPLS